MGERLHVGVFGAGAVGGYLGVLLSAAGARVTLVGRQSLLDRRDAGKLLVRNLRGKIVRPRADLQVATSVDALADVHICLVTVKSGATQAAGASIASAVSRDTPVLSMQNGLDNANILRGSGLSNTISGMVAYNVVAHDGWIAQVTSGPLMAGPGERPELMHKLVAVFERADHKLELRADMPAVLASKLLINLNNGICCVSGASIAESIASRDLRRSYAACIREGIGAFHHEKMRVARIGKLSPSLMARLLPMPDAIVRVLARPMVRIAPSARSSTLQDLEAGKPTEIDSLNGAIVRIAKRGSQPCGANEFVVNEVKRLEKSSVPRGHLTAHDIWRKVRALS